MRSWKPCRMARTSAPRGDAVTLLRQLLQVDHATEAGIGPIDELGIGALLDDAAAMEHADEVGVANRRQPVRDDQDRHLSLERVDALLDRALRLGVERARRLVED